MAQRKKKTRKKAKRKPAKNKRVGKKRGGNKGCYKADYAKQLIEFYDVEPIEEREIPHYKGKGKDQEVTWTDIKLLPTTRPTIRRFAKHIGKHVTTVYQWFRKDDSQYQDDFAKAYETCQHLIKDYLIDLAIAGVTPPTAFAFIAKNLTDMTDQQNIDHTSGGEKIQPQIVIYTKGKQ